MTQSVKQVNATFYIAQRRLVDVKCCRFGLGVGQLRLQMNRDSDYLAILTLFKVIGYVSDT